MIKKDDEDPRVMEVLKELQAPLETPNGVTICGRPQRRQRRKQHSTNSDKNTSNTSPMSPLFASPPLTHMDLQDDNLTTLANSALLETTPNETSGSLSIDEHGQVRYLGNSSGFYLLSDSRTYKDGVFHFTGYYNQQMMAEQQHQQQESSVFDMNQFSDTNKHNINPLEVPSHDLSKHLVELYLEHFYPVLPMFYKKTFASSTNPLEPVSPLLLNAIYAIASRISPDVNVRSDPNAPETAGHIFYERARRLLDDYYDTPKISTVQALLLMASYQMGAMKPAKAWLYSGMAFRMAQDLGLNRNCEHWNISPDERERRKRVFWCCYIVDRQMSAIYGRQSTFDDRDCDVPLPSVDDDEPITGFDRQARLLDVFIESIKLSDLLGHVLKAIYYAKSTKSTDSRQIDRIVGALHRQLVHWHNHLPSAIQYKIPNTQSGEQVPDPPAAIGQLHLMYYTTLILLHRSFIPGPKASSTQLPISLPSYKICELAATSIVDIATIMMNEQHLRYVYHYSVFYLFTAGIIFIKLASSSDPNRAFDAKINTNRVMKALDELENTWMNASRNCNILGELAGLRDIRLASDNKYVPKKAAKPSPQPSIAVPNSPPEMTMFGSNYSMNAVDDMKFRTPQQQTWKPSRHQRSASDMDPSLFAMPPFDPFAANTVGNTFFSTSMTSGMPSSLNEWNNYYFGSLNTTSNKPERQLSSSGSPSSVEISTSPSQSILLGLFDPSQQQDQQVVASPIPMSIDINNEKNQTTLPTDVLFW